MKVVILAGGFGTRISEYTKTIPKPMILINKVPSGTSCPIFSTIVCNPVGVLKVPILLPAPLDDVETG